MVGDDAVYASQKHKYVDPEFIDNPPNTVKRAIRFLQFYCFVVVLVGLCPSLLIGLIKRMPHFFASVVVVVIFCYFASVVLESIKRGKQYGRYIVLGLVVLGVGDLVYNLVAPNSVFVQMSGTRFTIAVMIELLIVGLKAYPTYLFFTSPGKEWFQSKKYSRSQTSKVME